MYLITGAEGQLGRAFVSLFCRKEISFKAFGHRAWDITNEPQTAEIMAPYPGCTVINCAAYNFVDGAEENQELAKNINSEAPATLAALCKRRGGKLIHFSSDFVFSSNDPTATFSCDAPVNPINFYGLTKAWGEERVRSNLKNHLIVRTSFVFGHARTPNIVHKLKDLLEHEHNRGGKPIIATRPISKMTYAPDLVKETWKLIQKNEQGTFHITNSETFCPFELASFLGDKLGVSCAIPGEYQTRAPRPICSTLDDCPDLPNWMSRVALFLKESPRGI